MLKIRPFEFADVTRIDVQPRHRNVVFQILALEDLTARVMVGPFSYTAERDGVPIVAAGIIESADWLGGRPVGRPWAILAADVGTAMVPISRAVKGALQAFPGQVIADIDEDHQAAVRWVQALGFERAAPGQWIHDAPKVL